MKHFPSTEKLDTGTLYFSGFTAGLEVLFSEFGLSASMANIIIKSSVLTDNLIMQQVKA